MKFIYGIYIDIRPILNLKGLKKELAIFTTEEVSPQAIIKLGYRRKIYIDRKAYLLWKNEESNRLEEITFEFS